MKRVKLFAVAAAVAAALATAGTAVAASDQPPGPPPWGNPDGTLNEESVPEWQAVVDETGATVGYARWRQLQQPPPPPSASGPLAEAEPVQVFDEPGGRGVGWVFGGRGFVKGSQPPD